MFYSSKIDNWEDVSYLKPKPDNHYTPTLGYSSKEEELDSTKLKEDWEVSKSLLGLETKLNKEL